MTAVAINKKIVSYSIAKEGEEPATTLDEGAIEELVAKEAEKRIKAATEQLKRPEMLMGATYQIRSPNDDHSIYVTINDTITGIGTESERRRPFEIFFNTKNQEHVQWMNALALITSAVFKNALSMAEVSEKAGDISFVVDQLRSVFDPKGGYYVGNGKFANSLVAQIGDCLEAHMITIGAIVKEEMTDAQKEIIEEKKQAFLAKNKAVGKPEESKESEAISGAVICSKCNEKAVIVMDGCAVCTACGDSRCS